MPIIAASGQQPLVGALEPSLRATVVCPECHGNLLNCSISPDDIEQIVPASVQDQEFSCQLRCENCARSFPVLAEGIPLLWSDALRNSFDHHETSQCRDNASEEDVKAANIYVYDEILDDYEHKSVHGDRNTFSRLEHAVSLIHFTGPGRHLDVGCGPGNILAATSTAKFPVKIGCDISLTALRSASSKGFSAVLGDAERLPFASDQFNLITAYSVLHHLFDPCRFVKEAYRTLADSGGLITDYDPNKMAGNLGWLAIWLYQMRNRIYSAAPFLAKRRVKIDSEETRRLNDIAEFHNGPGRGFVMAELERDLSNAGFQVQCALAHNTTQADLNTRSKTKPRLRHVVTQSLSLRNPMNRKYADTLLTVSTKPGE